jgi:hypothetical protein
MSFPGWEEWSPGMKVSVMLLNTRKKLNRNAFSVCHNLEFYISSENYTLQATFRKWMRGKESYEYPISKSQIWEEGCIEETFLESIPDTKRIGVMITLYNRTQ